MLFPSGILVRAQDKGWMDRNLMVDWVEKVRKRRPAAILCPQSPLTLDSFWGHLNDEVSTLINKPFKDDIGRLRDEWMAGGKHTLRPAAKLSDLH
jgi:hypothetical protein